MFSRTHGASTATRAHQHVHTHSQAPRAPCFAVLCAWRPGLSQGRSLRGRQHRWGNTHTQVRHCHRRQRMPSYENSHPSRPCKTGAGRPHTPRSAPPPDLHTHPTFQPSTERNTRVTSARRCAHTHTQATPHPHTPTHTPASHAAPSTCFGVLSRSFVMVVALFRIRLSKCKCTLLYIKCTELPMAGQPPFTRPRWPKLTALLPPQGHGVCSGPACARKPWACLICCACIRWWRWRWCSRALSWRFHLPRDSSF